MEKEIKMFIWIAAIIAVIYVLRFGARLTLSIFIFLAGLFGGDKEGARRIYIRINNIVAEQRLNKKSSAKMLILLPHCMQSKDCSCKVTEDIRNCRRCGNCNIGEIAEIIEEASILTAVAKGGTAARNIVKEFKPDFILAVACERELVSGIGDVGKIPVIGVINQRPNGYCTNTSVDIAKLKGTLEGLLGKGFMIQGKYELRAASRESRAKNPIA